MTKSVNNEDGHIFCNFCCKHIPEDEFEDHKAEGCTLMEKSFGAFLDSNTVICPHGCSETIRSTDKEAHSLYGCAVATKIGRGPVKTAAA
jgi:hypothetical protein